MRVGRFSSVLVSALTLPGMDGLELVTRIRATSEIIALPAIAMSAHVRPDEVTAALAAGYDLHVGKPVDVAQLVTAIDGLARIKPSGPAASAFRAR
ncbi:MAG: response regulator [Acidobacteria bacterium]|nr:response regulator [Acidobacteriota bacterium]